MEALRARPFARVVVFVCVFAISWFGYSRLNAQQLPRCLDDGYSSRSVPWEKLEWNGGKILARSDDGVHDESGVRMFRNGGKLLDHPAFQATYGLANIWTYSKTHDRFFLNRAAAQARRILGGARETDGALFFPYLFDFPLHGDRTQTMSAPWYSAMSQGIALSLFVRMYEQTRDNTWLAAARKTFGSLSSLQNEPARLLAHLDGIGYLWLQEYAGAQPDYTFNGHMFAMFGIFDFARLTSRPDAKRLFSCALTTVRRYAPEFRVKGGISFYCLAHRVQSAKYHALHVQELRTLYGYTGASVLARLADEFTSDHAPRV